ncbi:zinc finger protein 184 [Plutella xylostella]|uniref:zinc finger protein 184 n=1 Tax=Plutella xylostella TaxID=51655 RepID=UPI0020329BAC|nr:zinc finger protein 184 [Plutella xylostella]
MLPPSREDDDDDSHLCIKCNATVIGLDNYVKHRKQRCQNKYTQAKSLKTDIPSLDTLEPSYSLGADVFFQSLELQSSAKKPSVRLTPPIPVSSKTSQVSDRKHNLATATSSRDIPLHSPLESNLRGEDWIGGHSLRIGNSEADNQTKLINAVASISGTAKKDTSTAYNIVPYNDFKGDEESDEASEDSEDEEDDEPPTTGGKWKPPPHHTGGKWRPDSPEHDVWEMKEDHTGGKWKPLMPTDTQEGDEDYDAPPPGHTKGKWIPGAQESKSQIMRPTIQTKTSVQYWCGPCNRRLGTKAVYQKHLMSNLHMKKILPETDLEFSGPTDSSKSIGSRRSSRTPKSINDSIYVHENKRKRDEEVTEKLGKKKRKRKPYYTKCYGCESRVRVHLMGKHLISHYHFRKATDTSNLEYQKMLLDNMHAIVRQAPFQCSPCKFYSNWLSTFKQHWLTEEHQTKISSLEGKYWCSFCKFECDSSGDMLQHLSSPDHNDVVAVVNRSMPIIIRKRSVFKCKTCFKEFRYNIEVKKHCNKTGHEPTHTATDVYQELHNCHQCRIKFRSSLALAGHLKIKHKQKVYFCMVCSKSFKTSEEAVKHRQTSEHKIRRKEMLKERGVPIKDMRKKCPYCVDIVVKNVLDLKDHLERVHPDMKKKCPHCGMAFTLSQEVSHHVKSNACQFSVPGQLDSPTFWNCSQCLFRTDSQAECYFHEVLHTDPLIEVHKLGDEEKVVQKFVCPFCHKAFRKASLKHHIRQHTFERPFACSICCANFTRQSSLSNHARLEHGAGASTSTAPHAQSIMRKAINETKIEYQPNDHELYINNYKSNLKRAVPSSTPNETEVKIREHTCPHDTICKYVAATEKQLLRHRKSHHGERLKPHECPICTFKTDQSSHMKRHMRCHAGSKPYKCPHCPFDCGSLENLRKHVLTGGRHSGLYLYNCTECCGQFATNMAAELRSHLTEVHGDKYDTKTAIEAVKRHLMKDFTSDIGN